MSAATAEELKAVASIFYSNREHHRRRAQESFAEYVTYVQKDFKPARHHRFVCRVLDKVAHGEIKRLIVTQPPGTAKSTYCTKLFPAYWLGLYPRDRVIQGCHTTSLAWEFGRDVRDILKSPEHREVFGSTLASDSRARGDWRTSRGGRYFACGVDKGVTGRRGTLGIVDDPVKDEKDAESEVMRNGTWGWFKTAFRTRMLPESPIVIVTTRWHHDDVVGRILGPKYTGGSGWFQATDGEWWFVVDLPMEAEQDDILGREEGELLWPEFFTPRWCAIEKAFQGSRVWSCLYQNRPTVGEGAIISAAMWRKWPLSRPPVCDFLMQVYDTAFDDKEENDFSARTTWGVFNVFDQDWGEIGGPPRWLNKNVMAYHAIMVEAWRDQCQLPQLRKYARESYDLYKPDLVVIEKKASGQSLIQELRRHQIPIRAYTPDRSKTMRGHVAAITFEQGCMWYMDRAWARPVINECAQFPKGQNDDWYDTVTMSAWMLRRRFHLNFREEEEADEEAIRRPPTVNSRIAPHYG